MRRRTHPLLWTAALGLAGLGSAAFAAAADNAAAPVLVTAAEWSHMADTGGHAPLFAAEQQRAVDRLHAAMQAGIDVPLPRDGGGGYTHEQHKRNYRSIHDAGTLYRLTGNRDYAAFARDLLLAYAKLYPTLGPHPQSGRQIPGRIFWQILNDSVWLVYAVQGYDAIRDTLSAADRRSIDERLFRPMAKFLVGTPANFDLIHNHATWAAAGVGMTGYVLRDRGFVDQALLGSQRDGKSGFLRQIDQLFSPDGYYTEGPYYQRYALGPFELFARVIERNEPRRHIFDHHGGALLKAVDAIIQQSYAGLLLPLNDAIKDKGLDSEEIVAAVAIAYARTHDPGLLDIARRQNRTVLTIDGLAVAEGLQARLDQPFDFRPLLLRDGPQGERGGLALLRTGGEDGTLAALKATAQGMGHGHFDRLNWLFYDNGNEIVRDYGSARFLNINAKHGGIYLEENTTWAKQTIAHNTLTVDSRSQFAGKLADAEQWHPDVLLFDVAAGGQIAMARMAHAWEGVVATRTLALLEHADLAGPVVVDLLRVDAARAAQFDLPLHFNGQIIDTGFAATHYQAQRPVLGDAAGYQHLWVDAVAPASLEARSLTWLTAGRFYTYRFAASEPSQALLVESGAHDPEFNLRREQALIRRVSGAHGVSFAAVLEPHGRYDGTAETVTGDVGRIQSLTIDRGDDGDVVTLTLASGKVIALAIAREPAANATHDLEAHGRHLEWTGPYLRKDY